MWTVSEKPMWLMTASGDALKFDYIKKIFIYYEGFGLGKQYQVRAVVDGGAKADDWVIVEIFDKLDDAKNCIRNLIGISEKG